MPQDSLNLHKFSDTPVITNPLPDLAMQLVAAILCRYLAIFGFKSLRLFAGSNGLLGHLERQITKKATPTGKLLRTLNTGGRFPAVDLQLNAVASFLHLFCEDISQPDVNILGFWFAASWGLSWILVVLESFREYVQSKPTDVLVRRKRVHAVFVNAEC